MHFLLLGATGRTGQHVTTQLLSQNHTVTALVRDSSKLPTTNRNLTTVTGSPLSQQDILAAIRNPPPTKPDAVIITLNTVRASDSPFAAQVSPPRFLADSVRNVCEACQQEGVTRIIVMSTAGVGDSWAQLPWVSKAFMGWTNVKYALEDHGLVDEEMGGKTREELEWTLVRAVRLEFDDEAKKGGGNNGRKNKEVRTLGSAGKGMRMTDSVGVEAVASFLIKVAVERLFVREAVVVAD